MADLVIDSILAFASLHKDIQLVTLEGSRANINAKKDRFQDYDISFFQVKSAIMPTHKRYTKQ
ncbi:hypothetical protein BA915_04050 [Helicobacter pullorum]|nr:hypothetical protein BA915_04050 [Helicobacter pullorum]